MKRALLLNDDYRPLNFISDERAVRLVLKGRAEVVYNLEGKMSFWDGYPFTTVTNKIELPATLRLLNHVKKKWKSPRFRKKVLFNRDGWRCQYCNERLFWDTITIDHVLPRSRGGDTSWLNCVAACKPCNRMKADQTPEEADLRLLKKPTEPHALHFWDTSRSSVWHADWAIYAPQLHAAGTY